MHARLKHEPEKAIVATQRDLRLVIDEHGERRPRRQLSGQRNRGANRGVNLRVDDDFAIGERERDGGNVGGVRVSVGGFEKALAQLFQCGLIGNRRLRGCVRDEDESEHRRRFPAGPGNGTANLPRLDQDAGECQ